ncbi:MAG: hypothetical protein QXG86_01100 [Candidatus Woesearchaeota archaeon]
MAKKKISIFDVKKGEDEEFAMERGIEDEPEEHEGTHEEEKIKFVKGEKEMDVYSEEGREEGLEEDEIEVWEEGFAEGAESKSPLRKPKKKKNYDNF